MVPDQRAAHEVRGPRPSSQAAFLVGRRLVTMAFAARGLQFITLDHTEIESEGSRTQSPDHAACRRRAEVPQKFLRSDPRGDGPLFADPEGFRSPLNAPAVRRRRSYEW